MSTPATVVISDEPYRLTVFMIHSWNEDGSVGLCKVIPYDGVVDLNGGEEFMTAYVPVRMLKGAKGRRPSG